MIKLSADRVCFYNLKNDRTWITDRLRGYLPQQYHILSYTNLSLPSNECHLIDIDGIIIEMYAGTTKDGRNLLISKEVFEEV
jgi:hypothetical protein